MTLSHFTKIINGDFGIQVGPAGFQEPPPRRRGRLSALAEGRCRPIPAGARPPRLSGSARSVARFWNYLGRVPIPDERITKAWERLPEFRDNERFADAVRKCAHRVAISYQDDEQGAIRSLYRGFEILAADHTYVGSTLATKRKGKELLILNYDPPRNSWT